MHGETFLKSESAVRFSEKPSIRESVSFHREMFGVISVGLILHICIVNAMIFIKKLMGILVQDQF